MFKPYVSLLTFCLSGGFLRHPFNPFKYYVLAWAILFPVIHALAFSGQEYRWKTGNGSFNTASNWDPARTSPAVTDILYFDNGGTYTITHFPSSQAFAQLFIENGTNVTLDAGFSTLTLMLNGDGITHTDDFVIQSGSSLTLMSFLTPDITLRHATGAGNKATIDGVFNLGKSGQVLNNANYYSENSSDVVTTVNGTVNVYGQSFRGGTGSAYFSGTGIYNHAMTTTAGSIPLATWQSGSVAKITGYTINQVLPLNFFQTYYDLEWNCPGQATDISMSGQYPSVNGTFRLMDTGTGSLQLHSGSAPVAVPCARHMQTGGTFDLAGGSGNAVLQVSGAFDFLGGTITASGTASQKGIEFNGATTQHVIMSGQVTAPVDLIVNNEQSVSGVLKLGAGADLIMKKGAISSQPDYLGNNGLVYNGQMTQVAGPEWTGSIDRLTIDNGAGVNAVPSMNVTSELHLQAGLLNLGGATLTLGTGTSSPGSYIHTSGHIVGKLRRWLEATAGTRDFHIGTTTNPRTIQVDYTTAPLSGGSITATYLEGSPGTAGLPITAGGVSIVDISATGYWRTASGDGLSGGTYTVTVDATGFAHANGMNITDPSQVRLIKRPTSGSWTPEGTSEVPVSLSGLQISGLQSFSEFGVGEQGLLPVELTGFSVAVEDQYNQIQWEVASQQFTEWFELERSEDAKDWSLVGRITAAGTTTEMLTYQMKDYDPPCQGYYRLRSIDYDGYTEVFPMVSTNRDCDEFTTALYPNPFHSELVLECRSVEATREVQLQICDVAGRVYIHTVYAFSSDQPIQRMELQTLPPGIYFAAITYDGKRSVQRVLKQ